MRFVKRYANYIKICPQQGTRWEVAETDSLRSGKEIDKSAPLITKKSEETPVEEKKDETESLRLDDIEQCPIPPPFPQALKLPRKLDTAFEILEHLHQVKINLPLLHVLGTYFYVIGISFDKTHFTCIWVNLSRFKMIITSD